MMMHKRYWPLAIVALTSYLPQAWAGGFAINSVAARAASMQAFSAVADDASAIFYNPAGLTQSKGSEISGNLQLIFEDIKFVNKLNNVASKSHKVVPAPSFFYSTDQVKGIKLGLGIYSPFAKVTNYQINSAVNNVKHKSSVIRLDFVPTIAFELNNKASLGLGLVFGKTNVNMDILGLHTKGHGMGVSAQGGLLLNIQNGLKFGLAYKGPMTVKLKGQGVFAQANVSDRFRAKMRFPGLITSGLAWQINDPWLVSFNYDYEMWSSIKKYQFQYNNAILNSLGTIPLNAKDSQTFRIGTLYKPQPENEYRAGYSFVSAAVPAANVIPAQPDVTFHALSLGYSSYHVQNMRFDIGYQCEIANKLYSTHPIIPGKYSGFVHSVFIGMNYKFN
ncbi:MAG: putative Porin [Francisellaceae bacterium]|nr:putative Porin [Francisellaceae bacterium]